MGVGGPQVPELLWDLDLMLEWVPPLRIVDVLMSTVFLIDVALQFVHGSMHRGYPELRLRRIARRYLRTYFVPDLLASLPYGLMGTSPALQAIGMVRVLRMLCVLPFEVASHFVVARWQRLRLPAWVLRRRRHTRRPARRRHAPAAPARR